MNSCQTKEKNAQLRAQQVAETAEEKLIHTQHLKMLISEDETQKKV